MSLGESILEIAGQIEADITNLPKPAKGTALEGGEVRMLLVGYARQLRSAVKASEGSTPIASAPVRNCRRCTAPWTGEGPFCLACQEDAKQQAEKRKFEAVAEESDRFQAAYVLDGPSFVEGQSTLIQVASGMPLGAYTRITGERYRLTKEGLRHAPEHGAKVIVENAPGIVLGK